MYNKLIIKEKIIPPKKPSIVLLGLIIFNNFLLPKFIPIIYEKISNDITVIIMRLNLFNEISENEIQIKDDNRYVKINSLYFLKFK